jgi:hypothetical protein
MTIKYDNNESCIKIEKKTQFYLHVKMKHIEIPLSFRKREKKSVNEKLDLTHVLSQE